jgi:hypothetical protein
MALNGAQLIIMILFALVSLIKVVLGVCQCKKSAGNNNKVGNVYLYQN